MSIKKIIYEKMPQMTNRDLWKFVLDLDNKENRFKFKKYKGMTALAKKEQDRILKIRKKRGVPDIFQIKADYGLTDLLAKRYYKFMKKYIGIISVSHAEEWADRFKHGIDADLLPEEESIELQKIDSEISNEVGYKVIFPLCPKKRCMRWSTHPNFYKL